MTGILDIDRSTPGEPLTGAARPRWQHAVEHINAACHPADQICRLANPHQIAGPIGAHQRCRKFQRLEHGALTLAHRQTANGIAFEIDLFQRGDGFGTQLRKDRSLHNAELAITGTRDKRVAGSFGPAHGKAHRLRCLRFGRRKGCTFIERHGDGRIQKMLDFSGAFRRQAMLAAVKMGFEGHPILIQFAQRTK